MFEATVANETSTRLPTKPEDFVWVNEGESVYEVIQQFTDKCDGGNLSDEVSYVTFGEYTITSEGWLMKGESDSTLFTLRNKPEQIYTSAKGLKVISDALGVTYNKNASKKVMIPLILEFMKKIVDILNT